MLRKIQLIADKQKPGRKINMALDIYRERREVNLGLIIQVGSRELYCVDVEISEAQELGDCLICLLGFCSLLSLFLLPEDRVRQILQSVQSCIVGVCPESERDPHGRKMVEEIER